MEILAMGKYGAYVWSSFALAAIVLLVCVLQARQRHKNVMNELRTRITTMEPEK